MGGGCICSTPASSTLASAASKPAARSGSHPHPILTPPPHEQQLYGLHFVDSIRLAVGYGDGLIQIFDSRNLTQWRPPFAKTKMTPPTQAFCVSAGCVRNGCQPL